MRASWIVTSSLLVVFCDRNKKTTFLASDMIQSCQNGAKIGIGLVLCVEFFYATCCNKTAVPSKNCTQNHVLRTMVARKRSPNSEKLIQPTHTGSDRHCFWIAIMLALNKVTVEMIFSKNNYISTSLNSFWVFETIQIHWFHWLTYATKISCTGEPWMAFPIWCEVWCGNRLTGFRYACQLKLLSHAQLAV